MVTISDHELAARLPLLFASQRWEWGGIGAHYCMSNHPLPFRPHQPHPAKAFLWCVADVLVHSAPTVPTGAEQVAEVRTVDVAEASRLLSADADWLPELVWLAVQLRPAGR